MGTTDDSLLALNRLDRTIKDQRALLLQAHGVLTCLYEVLLHGEGAEAVSYAQAAYVAYSADAGRGFRLMAASCSGACRPGESG